MSQTVLLPSTFLLTKLGLKILFCFIDIDSITLNFIHYRKTEQVPPLLNSTLLEPETRGNLLDKYSITPDDANPKMRNTFLSFFSFFSG